MGQPDVKELMVAGPLQDASIQYKNLSYIGDRVFPLIDTNNAKATIAKYLKGAWFRDEAKIRGPGARAARGGYPVSLISIAPIEYAFAKEVTDEDRRDADSINAPPTKPEQDAIEFCADRIDLNKERRIAALVKATDWSGAGAGGEDAQGLWAPPGSTNTFILDVETRIETIRANTGQRPNVLVIDGSTFGKIKQVAEVLDRIRYGGGNDDPAKVGEQMIAAMFGLNEVLIGDAIYSSAKESKAGTDFSAVNIWENTAAKGSAFLFYRPKNIGLRVPTAGIQVRLLYPEGMARRTTTWREAAEHQDVYEVAESTDIVATGTDLGFMWKDTMAD